MGAANSKKRRLDQSSPLVGHDGKASKRQLAFQGVGGQHIQNVKDDPNRGPMHVAQPKPLFVDGSVQVVHQDEGPLV